MESHRISIKNTHRSTGGPVDGITCKKAILRVKMGKGFAKNQSKVNIVKEKNQKK